MHFVHLLCQFAHIKHQGLIVKVYISHLFLFLQSIFISRISEGGAADRCAALIVGDKVLSLEDDRSGRLRESMEVEHHKPLVRGPLGLSIVGGIDHSSYPFGADKPGIFISKIVPNGSAAQTNLCVGDRLLKEVFITKAPGEKLGISIRGGNKGHPGNPLDKNDEGIFISKINDVGAAAREGTLGVGQRILEVNGQSMLGCKHGEAVRALRGAGDKLTLLVCDGYDPEEVEYWRSRPGEMNNPLSQVDHQEAESGEEMTGGMCAYQRGGGQRRDLCTLLLARSKHANPRPSESQLQNEADEFEKEELEKMEALRKQQEEATQRLLTEENEEEPLRIDGEKSEPESLGFKDKWKRFEEQIDEQAHSTPKSTSKKVALVSQADLNNMKVDKERKQNQVTETNENDGLSAEDRRRKILGLDPLPEAPPRASYFCLTQKQGMKDLEDDALQAHIILETDYSKTKLRVDGSVPNGNSAPDVQITTSGGIEDIKFMDE
ncbi:hypothetical protein BSL78_28609, partial [Apostichopus japonicus]